MPELTLDVFDAFPLRDQQRSEAVMNQSSSSRTHLRCSGGISPHKET